MRDAERASAAQDPRGSAQVPTANDLSSFDPDPAFLADLAASIPGALYRIVAGAYGQWRFTYLSQGIHALYGISVEEVLADPMALAACMWEQDREPYRQANIEAFRNMTALHQEYRITARGGQVRWIEVKAVPRHTATGEVSWTGILLDVSQRKRAEAALRVSEATYRTLFETVPQGVVYHDATGAITAANPAAQRILGLTLDQMQGRESIDPRWKTIHEDGSDFPGDQHPAMRTLATGQPVHDVLMGVAVPERGYVWILVNAVPVIKDGQLTAVYASFEDITQRVLLSRELREQASTDFLTGVANRRSFMERLTAEFERIRRYPDSPGCVLALDLDFFKRINDSYGHAAGDAVLAQVAGVMRQMTRRPDVLGRTGGEEFMLLLPDTGIDEAMALAERLRERVERTPMRFEWREIAITVSIGASELRATDPGPETALVRADRALYIAKQEGRNCVRMSG